MRGTRPQIEQLAPATFERIGILKGETAGAKYGERVRRGVVVVITKK